MAVRSQFAESLRRPSQWIILGLIVLCFAFVALEPINRGVIRHVDIAFLDAHAIALAMYSYADDHNGVYPTGQSSTEIFQKLLDGGYISDPSILYVKEFKIPSKFKATSTKLEPKNVCWDVTVPIDSHASIFVPVVFTTGFKVKYVPSGNAVPLFPPSEDRSFVMVVSYYNMDTTRRGTGIYGPVPNVIDERFESGGKTYQQLTPDGPLPP